MSKIHLTKIMTKQLMTMKQHESTRAAFELMHQYNLQHIPIVDHNGRLIGLLSDRDILVDAQRRLDNTIMPSEVLIGEVMSSKVITCGPKDDIRAAIRLMLENQVHAIPIVNNDSHLIGIVTSTDAMRLLLDEHLHRQKYLPVMNESLQTPSRWEDLDDQFNV